MSVPRFSSWLVAAVLAALATTAPAQIVERLSRLEGAQEVPPVPSPARGLAFSVIDVGASTLTYRVAFLGLSSAETMAHIHGFTAPGTNAGVVHPLPLGALKCGVWGMTTAQQANVIAGLAYYNVHSVMFPAGEIRGQIDIAPDQATFCFGDGSGSPCPCANFSSVGDDEGCRHSLGYAARLRGYVGPSASASLSNDKLVLHALRMPPNSPVLFFQGTLMAAGGAGVPFGDGLRCIDGNVRRLAIKQGCGGQAGLPEPGDLALSVSGGVGVPGTILYQGWYRNPPTFCTTAAFNLTNGVSVNWVP